MRFLPVWEERFTVAPRRPRNAHRRLDPEQRLEEILNVRVARQVADDHTVSWDGTRWGVPREEVCAGLRGARWKSNGVWMARTGYVSAAATCACAIAQHPCDRPLVLPAYGLQDLRNEHQTKTKSNPNTMCLRITPGGNRGTGHFYLAKNRTFLLCVDTNSPTRIRQHGAGSK